MRLGLESRDLRFAALRGGVIVAFLLIPYALAASKVSFRQQIVVASNLAMVGLVVAVLALVERHVSRNLSPDGANWVAVWVAGIVLWPLVAVQTSWAYGLLVTGSVAAGTQEIELMWEQTPVVLFLALFPPIPGAILAGARLQSTYPPLALVLGWTGLLCSPLLFMGGPGAFGWGLLLTLMLCLHGLFGLADWTDRRLGHRALRPQVDALHRRALTGELSPQQIVALGRVEHEPAQIYLARKAPDRCHDLRDWVERIDDPVLLQHAAAATARLTRAAWEETPTVDPEQRALEARAITLVDRWARTPSPDVVAEAQEVLDQLTASAEAFPARLAVSAITAEPDPVSFPTIRTSTTDLALQAAEQVGEDLVRDTIREAIVEQVLNPPSAPDAA